MYRQNDFEFDQHYVYEIFYLSILEIRRMSINPKWKENGKSFFKCAYIDAYVDAFRS